MVKVVVKRIKKKRVFRLKFEITFIKIFQKHRIETLKKLTIMRNFKTIASRNNCLLGMYFLDKVIACFINMRSIE